MAQNDKRIDELFEAVLDVLIQEMKSKEPSPPMVQAALRFLADNKVEKIPQPGSRMAELANSAPFKLKG